MAKRIYKLELRNPSTGERVDFGPRKLGDVGRDILIVKKTLGGIIDYQSLISSQDAAASIEDPDGWFDCISGTKITDLEAATFDKSMLAYLTKFQLDNQYYILSYLFSKFAVEASFAGDFPNTPATFDEAENDSILLPGGGSIALLSSDGIYANDVYATNQIDLLTRLYNMEFGTLGEATLAVLHGWIPRTRIGETSYHHDPRIFQNEDAAYDVSLLGLYESFTNDMLAQSVLTSPDVLEPLEQSNTHRGNALIGSKYVKNYKSQVAAKEDIRFGLHISGHRVRPSIFGTIKYKIKPEGSKSALYDSFLLVSTEFPKPKNTTLTSAKDFSDILQRAAEPNPLIDPDPVVISSSKTVFFDRTSYTLRNLPPRIDEATATESEKADYRHIIRELEDLALSRILEFYNKPNVWIVDPETQKYKVVYNTKSFGVSPDHNGSRGPTEKFVLTSSPTIREHSLLQTFRGPEGEVVQLGEAEDYNRIEYINYETGEVYDANSPPLIKFTEFRTPSLRPGDVYRARFEINKIKLDLISEGVVLEAPQLDEIVSEDLGVSQAPLNVTAINPSCANEPLSKQDEQRRYEEYRALASRRKREIARMFRERALESYNNDQTVEKTTVDLGVFGNVNLNIEASDDRPTGFDVASQALDMFGTLLGSDSRFNPQGANPRGQEIVNPQLADFTALKIGFQELTTAANSAAANIREAYGNSQKERVQFVPANYDGNDEASRLQNSISEIKTLVLNQTQGQGIDLGASASGEVNVAGFFGTEAQLDFTFEPHKNGLKITSLKVDGRPVDVKDLRKNSGLRDTLGRPRTVGYLAQIRQMSDRNGSILSALGLDGFACSDLNLGKKGLAYIAKHTMSLTGRLPEEYDNLHRWTQDQLTSPLTEWKNSLLAGIESDLEVKLGVDEVLDLFGDKCVSIDAIVKGFLNELRFGNLLCKYMKCVRLPKIDYQYPNFKLPGRPDFKIFGWLRGIIEQMYDKWKEIVLRILCSLAKLIIDFLKAPFCAEQLREELFGAAQGASPGIQNALASALADLNLRPENIDKSKQLVDEMVLFLTGDEICRILQGGEIDAPTMNMIIRLADRLGIEEVDTEESLRSFFETISLFLPEGFCDDLAEATSIIAASSCEETANLLDQIRRRMLANEATDEEIARAVDLANENLISQATALEALGKGGVEALLPPILEFGNPDAIIGELPGQLGDQIVKATKSLFETAKLGYVSSLSSYGPSLFLGTSRLPKPSDPEYGEESSIIVETILENLREFTRISAAAPGALSEEQLQQQLFVLYRVFELETYPGSNGIKVPKIFQHDGATGRYVAYDNRGKYATDTLFLKPMALKERGFFYTDTEANILDAADIEENYSDSYGTRTIPMDDENSLMHKFSFVAQYKMTKHARDREEITHIEMLSFLQEKINQRLSEMQDTLQTHLANITTSISEETYLGVIKDLLDFSYENERERRNIQNQRDQGLQEREIVNTTVLDGRPTLDLSLATGPQRTNIRLSEFRSTAASSRFDPYTIEINNSPLFGGRQVFEYCDTIPGPGLNEETITQEQSENRQMFEDAISDIPAGLYTRKELFARKMWESVRRKVNFIYDEPLERARPGAPAILDQLDGHLNNFLHDYAYDTASIEFLEGIFEQIFFSLRDSRIYDEEGYYPGLKRRVNGELYITQDGCYKNRYNVSQFGILSFERMVTDELKEQINIELAKPENQPDVLDFDDLGPIEKAIQNVCLVGFVRVCIVELLLKGSLAYSVWDVEGVADEPFLKDFVLRYVQQELESKTALQDKWQEIISRITGIEQANFALKDVVQKQLIKVQGASKKIFENSSNLDYYNWFVKYFVPQTEVSRNISGVSRLDTRDPRGIIVRRVDLEGNLRQAEAMRIDEIPDEIYWIHPLYEFLEANPDPRNRVRVEDAFSEIRDPVKLARDLVNGNNPFFHIEHCLEVTGPLARLEQLILPSVAIVSNIVNANVNNPDDASRITEVDADKRNIPRLNVLDAHGRFVNLPFPNLADYNLSARPQIQEGAALSSVEFGADLNKEHEIYHIDDFVDALSESLNSDHLDKYLLHIRGLMHFDENVNAPGGTEGNTSVPAAEGMPDAIRRMPTRFITRKRRVVKFLADFVSSDLDNFTDITTVDELPRPIRRYKDGLYGQDGLSPSDYFTPDNERSLRDHEDFNNYVAIDAESEKYYVLPSNGEEFLSILSANPDLELEADRGQFLSYMIDDNGTATDDSSGSRLDFIFDTPFENNPLTIGVHRADEVIQSGYRGLESDLQFTSLNRPLDTIEYDSRIPLQRANQRVFDNKLGVFDNREQFLGTRDRYAFEDASGAISRQDETWVETVFDFSDASSIIAGLHGSFTIGETFDPAVLNFVPTGEVIETFDNALRATINDVHGQNAFDKLSVSGFADPKLTQYGRTFFTLEAEEGQPAHVYLSRPMGIDRYTNKEVTRYWTSLPYNRIASQHPDFKEVENGSFINPLKWRLHQVENDPRQNDEAAVIPRARERGLVMIHETPSIQDGEMVHNSRSLLPPNFYKIPLRVLITQVYVNNSQSPSEVYCKVVPPRYIREMHNDDELQTNIGNLNSAIAAIANEYVEFVENNRADIDPQNIEFTTDFTRNHEEQWNRTNINVINREPPKQYCSIERVYSQVFREETEEEDYNSEEQLDILFSDRGNLLSRQEPTISSLNEQISPEDYTPTGYENQRIDKKHYLESNNYFYGLSQDATRNVGIGLQGNNDPVDFHKVVFSLHNVFQWYLRQRRKNTLWGQLTRPVTDLSDMAGGEGQQRFPLAQSYSEEIARPEGFFVPGTYNVHLKWAIGKFENKDWGMYINSRPGPNGFLADPDRDDTAAQPGFITLYPGSRDVDNILTEARDETGARINKEDLSEWSYYGSSVDGHKDGLNSDGAGSNFVNYNRVETSPIRNVGSSLFYADGSISQMDISAFIRSVVRKLLDDNYTGSPSIPAIDPVDLFDFARLIDRGTATHNWEMMESILLEGIRGPGAEDQSNTGFYLQGPRDSDGNLLPGQPNSIFKDVPGFDPGLLSITEEKISEAIDALEHLALRLYAMSAGQAAFSVKSEFSQYNKDSLHSPYRLLILRRFLMKVRSNGNTPLEKLFLLCLSSTSGFSTKLAAARPSAPIFNDEDLLPWAAACLHYLSHRWVRNWNRDPLKSIVEQILVDAPVDPETQLPSYPDATWKVGGQSANPLGDSTRRARDVGGDDTAESLAVNHWDNLMRHITNLEQSPHQIIRAANDVIHSIHPDATQETTDENPFINNALILEKLLSAEQNEQYLINKYGDLYNDSYERFFTATGEAFGNSNRTALERIASPNSHLTGYINSTMQNEMNSGNIEAFFLKMDYKLFYQTLGLTTEDHIGFHPSSAYFIDHLRESIHPHQPESTVLDYYRDLMPRILYKSEKFRTRKEELLGFIKNNHEDTVEAVTEDWKDAFDIYSGITAELLSAETLRDAIISGQLVQGLLRNSEINQVARLVANTFTAGGDERNQAMMDFREFVRASGPIQETSEEFRTFSMAKPGSETGVDFFSVPLAEMKKQITAHGQLTIDCFDLSTFRRDYKRLQPWLTEQLIESDEARQVFEYIFPVKRFQAISTAFATSALAGYGGMTSVMQAPKASLASLIDIVGMSPTARSTMFDNFSQADFYKHMKDNASSNPQALSCFDFPGPLDFFEQFMDTLIELIKEFPSLFFRGIAGVADPAYKEMKLHWEKCNIDKLTFSGVKRSTVNYKNMTAGLVDPDPEKPLDGKYAMVIPSSLIDIPLGVAAGLSNPLSSNAWAKLGRALERTTGYLYKGPLAIADGVFSFSIPCLEDGATQWPGESPAPFHLDRYGHPMSPLTVLALLTDELKGDKKLREQSGCAENPYSRESVENGTPCGEPEPKPFGDMPKPEE